MVYRLVGSLLVLAAAGLGCRPPVGTAPGLTASEPPWFEDITERAGLNFQHDAGPTGAFFMPQVMGSGGALLDMDGDGRLDIYLVQNAGPKSSATNRLYRQQADGSFRDVSVGSGLDVAGHGMGVAIGDVNNDGQSDILLTEYGKSRLFTNKGGIFQDVSQEAGIDNPSWGTSAAFFDFDRDGWLDLVIVNYVDYNTSPRCGNVGGWLDYCHPNMFPGTVARLFRNLGKSTPGKIRFEDVTVKSGLAARPSNGLGVLCDDFDGDGWPDIFAANDSQANHLWINQKDGTFKEEAILRGLAYNGMGQTAANMGVAWGDVDGDSLPDLFVTHLGDETHTLWRQGPRGRFQDRSATSGVTGTGWRGTGFGAAFADLNQDGANDLVLVNGRVTRAPGKTADGGQFWSLYAERHQLLVNDGRGRFRDLSTANPALSATPAVGRGLLVGDVDNDGSLDLLVTEVAGPARLLRNVAPDRGHWLGIRAVTGDPPRDAIGATVTVRVGERVWVRAINPGYSYLSSCDPRAHFGLGTVNRIDSLHIKWPDGTTENFSKTEVNCMITIRQGTGTPATREAR